MALFKISALAALLIAALAVIGVSATLADSGSTGSQSPSGLTVTYMDIDDIPEEIQDEYHYPDDWWTLNLLWTRGTNPDYTDQSVQWRESEVTPVSWSKFSVPVEAESISFVGRYSSFERGRTYTFRIAGMIDDSEEGYSNEVQFAIPAEEEEAEGTEEDQEEATPTPTPAPTNTPPSGLTATVENGNVVLNWTPGNDSRYAKQVVKRRQPKQGWTSVDVDVDASTYTDSAVTAGKKYIYRIEAVRSNGKVLAVSKPAQVTVPE